MGNGHNHSHSELANHRLYWAVVINIILTVAQVVGGLLSGSLSLLADALHNFSDAGALLIAAIAAKIANIPANQKMTFGYKRAEILGALINSTTLVLVGLYLIYEAIHRYFDLSKVDGETVIWVAGLGLVINTLTALLTYGGSKDSMNIKAAFIHNISDAAASLVVMLSGVLMVTFQIYIFDLIATIIISLYVLYHAFFLIRDSIFILMQSTPTHLNINEIKQVVESESSVTNFHHIHIWQLDDKKVFLEAHVVIDENKLAEIESIKNKLRQTLWEKFSIGHTTFEFEISGQCSDCSVSI